MILSFRFFPGDEVLNLLPHAATDGSFVKINAHGVVQSVSEDHKVVTVSWDSETDTPVTSMRNTGQVYPVHTPPDLERDSD